MIGYVAEYQTADDAADEEGRLRRGAEEGLVANPLELANEKWRARWLTLSSALSFRRPKFPRSE